MIIILNEKEFDTADAVETIQTKKYFDDTPRGGVDGGESTIYIFEDGEFQVTPCKRQTIVQYSGFTKFTGRNALGDNRARIVSA